MSNTDHEVVTRTVINHDLKEPPMFKVIYINDNKTPMGFVIETLIEHFDYNLSTAENITMDIHEQGAATVAVLPYEIAEQKGIEVTLAARQQNYPLQVKLEVESAD